jgi:HEAT repeat protein
MKPKYTLPLLVIVLVAGGAWFEPTRSVRGLLRGEPFYQRRPASWWREKLASQDPTDQAEYPRRLREGGVEAVPVLSELLEAAIPEVRWQAADILGKTGSRADPAARLLALTLKDPDPHVRLVAATALGEIGPKGVDASVVPALIEVLKTPDRAIAIRPLSKFAGAASAAVPALIVILNSDPNSTNRWEAARTLGKIGPASKPAIPDLVRAMKSDADESVREHAAEALGDIGPDATEAVPDLVVTLADPAAKVRRDAVRSLGQIGPGARAALPAIKKLLADPEAIVQEAAKLAARRIDSVGDKK